MNGDLFVVAALQYWCRKYIDILGELLATILSARYPAVSPNKRKRSGVKNNQLLNLPTGEQVLSHLDELRQHLTSTSQLQIYNLESMQKALQQAQAGSTDSLKKYYGDLFSLAEVNGEPEISPSLPATSSRKNAQINNSVSMAKGNYKKVTTYVRDRTTFKRVPPRDQNTESSDQTSGVSNIIKINDSTLLMHLKYYYFIK